MGLGLAQGFDQTGHGSRRARRAILRVRMPADDALAPAQLALLEAVAAARGQTLMEMMESLEALGGGVEPSFEQLMVERPALTLKAIAPVIDQLPTLEALEAGWSPIQVKLVTFAGLELIAVACDQLGPMARCLIGALCFPGEDRVAERMQAHAVTEVDGRAVFLPFEGYAASVLGEKPGSEQTCVFSIHSAELESAPNIAEA